MSTHTEAGKASSVLFGQTRRAVLALLYGHADESFYLRQIARATGTGLGAVQRELRQLHDADIIRRTVQGNLVLYQANSGSSIFEELKSLLTKTAGVYDIIREALMSLAERIRIAFVYGSVARRNERAGSDVDVMVVGNVSFGDVVSCLERAQKMLGREINPTVYPVAEFRSKLQSGNHFLTSLLKQEKLFIIGDERELARMASNRLAHPTPQ
jgi:predicted nucleotidyltransferase